MSKVEEKLKKLESKIDRLSEQLHATGELVFNLHQILLKVSGDLAQTLEASRMNAEKREREELSVERSIEVWVWVCFLV